MDLYRIMLGLDGKEIKSGEKSLRIADVIADALLVPLFENEPVEQKLLRGRLARKLVAGGVVELSDDEKSVIISCANSCVQSPLILSYIHDELK